MTFGVRHFLNSFALVTACVFSSSAVAMDLSPSVFQWKKIPHIERLQEALSELKVDSEAFRLIQEKKASFQVFGESRSPEMSTLRFQHYYRGVKVLGSQSLQHRSSVLSNESTWTHELSNFDLQTVPTLSAVAAMGIARTITGGREIAAEPSLLILPSRKSDSARLIYRFVMDAEGEEAGRIVDVNAHSGELLANISRHWTIAPVNVFATNKTCQVLEPAGDDEGGRAPVSVDYRKCDEVVKAGVASPAPKLGRSYW